MFVPRRAVAAIVATGVMIGLVFTAVRGDDKEIAADAKGALRDSFEEEQPIWLREYSDATVKLRAHERSNRAAHGGRLSERFEFEAGGGSRFFVSYATPHIPVSDNLNVVLFVRSNRAGVQIFLRVVLPKDVDPAAQSPTFILIPGPIFDQIDRWQRLEMSHIAASLNRQVEVKRAEVNRPISLEGAYVELVLVNLLGEPGSTEVFLDDLAIRPVPQALLAEDAKPKGEAKGKASDAALPDGAGDAGDHRAHYAPFRLERNFLQKLAPGPQYLPWFPTAIDAPGADVAKLRGAGFDILFDDVKAVPARLEDALRRGFMFIPRLRSVTAENSNQGPLVEMAGFPFRSAVVFWHLGDRLGRDRERAARETEIMRTRGALGAMRKLDDKDSHVGLATVEGDLPLFARAPVGLDSIAIRPRFWSANVSLLENYAYLMQRREATVGSNLGALFWSWIPAMAPPAVSRNIWGDDTPPDSAWIAPPVQAAQLRLMTYLALSAGYRGLVFEGDAGLTRNAGEILRIEMSFLNLEIDLFEDIFATNYGSIPTYGVYDPNPPVIPPNATKQRRAQSVKELPPRPGMLAAAIPLRERKGVVLLVGDYADMAQFQPPQMAADKVRLVPVLPQGAQVFEITPGEVRVLTPTREAGGREFFIQEFDTTSLLLCTTDLSLYQRVQAQIDSLRPKAVPMAIRQAELFLQEVREVHRRLEADGHQIRSDDELKMRRKAGIETRPPDARDLLAKSEEYIKSARDAYEREDYAWAWAEARRASRPLRVLMHGHWTQANAALLEAASKINPKRPNLAATGPKPPPNPPLLVPPVACPPVVSFYTLPEAYIWLDWIKGQQSYAFGPNRVPSGSFDDETDISGAGWVNVGRQMEGIKADISTVRADETEPKEPWMFGHDPEREAQNRVIKLTVTPEDPKALDSLLPPVLDFPVAAIRSPEIRVEANNLIRISVLVKRQYKSPPGLGGVIICDSIGGEQFQFRTSAEIARFSRVILFRKAPANGTFTVTLGLAGYQEAYFDDFRVEVIEEGANPTPGSRPPAGSPPAGAAVARARRRSTQSDLPPLPDPNLPASASRASEARRQQR
jgi:hypothetical protein